MLAPAAQQLVDRHAVGLAGDIPERAIDRRHAEAVLLTQCPLEVVPDHLALEGVLADEVVGDHGDLGIRDTIAADILAGDPRFGLDGEDVAALLHGRSLEVDVVEAVVVVPEFALRPNGIAGR